MASYLKKSIKILGSAVSVGQPKKGVEHTPLILKNEQIDKLIDPSKAQWVNIVNQPKSYKELLRQAPIRNLKENAIANQRIYNAILTYTNPSDFLLNIGGDHSIGSSTVSALYRVHNENLAVIWIDAHGDCNTPLTSPSGNYHGMPLAHVLGLFKEPEFFDWGQPTLPLSNLAMIGIRDLDTEEKALMDNVGIVYFTMDQIKKMGIERVMNEVMNKIDPFGDKMIHVSLDVDGFDPILFPGTGTRSPGGLDFDHYKNVVKHIRQVGERFVALDIVEVNFKIERDITLMNVKEILKHTFH